MSTKTDSKNLSGNDIRQKVFNGTLFFQGNVSANNARAAVDEINKKVVPRLKELGLFKEEKVKSHKVSKPVKPVPDKKQEQE